MHYGSLALQFYFVVVVDPLYTTRHPMILFTIASFVRPEREREERDRSVKIKLQHIQSIFVVRSLVHVYNNNNVW